MRLFMDYKASCWIPQHVILGREQTTCDSYKAIIEAQPVCLDFTEVSEILFRNQRLNMF